MLFAVLHGCDGPFPPAGFLYTLLQALMKFAALHTGNFGSFKAGFVELT